MQFLLDNCNQNNKSNMWFYKLSVLLLSVDYRAGEFLHIYQSCFFKFSSLHKRNAFCVCRFLRWVWGSLWCCHSFKTNFFILLLETCSHFVRGTWKDGSKLNCLLAPVMPFMTSALLFSFPSPRYTFCTVDRHNKWISAFFTEFTEIAAQGCCPDTFTGRRLSVLLECSLFLKALWKEATHCCSQWWPLIATFHLYIMDCYGYYIKDLTTYQFTKGVIYIL